jgi:PST family polysaccharide transporter
VVRRAALREAGGLYLMQGLGNLMGVATIALLARRLGPEAYGTLAFAQGLLNYMAYLVNYGLDLSASREASRRKGTGELSALVAEVLLRPARAGAPAGSGRSEPGRRLGYRSPG